MGRLRPQPVNPARRAPAAKVIALPSDPESPAVEVGTRGRRRRRKNIHAAAEDLYPQGLAPSFWFDSGSGDKPYSATIRLTGRRNGATGRLGRRDSFSQDEVIDGIIPRTGPISITTRVNDVNAGEWTVAAEMLPTAGIPRSTRQAMRLRLRVSQVLHSTAWSWRRWALSAGTAGPIKTRWAPLVNFERMPAVIPGSWAGLVLLGVIAGLTLQAVLISRLHLDVARVLAVGIVASLVGVLGAKAWYIALNRRTWRTEPWAGLCIQGFLASAVAVGLGGLFLLRLPIGPVLDATAPGLFFGVAIGRLGCFFTGCCAGRRSASKWAIWSSDRRVGARRIPTQLLESLAGLSIGVPALLAEIYARPAAPGAIFVASCAAYTLFRQGLLRLRGEARRSTLGGPIAAAAAAAVLALSLSAMLVG